MSQNEMQKLAGNLILKFALANLLAVAPVIGSAASLRKPAAINRAAIVFAAPSKYFNKSGKGLSPELVDSYNKVKAEQKPFDFAQVVPLSIQPTNDSNRVFNQIADQSLSSYFSSAEMRATPLGKTATHIEEKMKQDISFQAKKIEHKFTFQVQAFQTVARVDYKGITNATLKYQANASSMGLEIYDKIPNTKNKDLVLSHVSNPSDRISSLSVRWGF